MNPGHPRSDRLDALDGLRGIAILIVVWFHAWQICWAGMPYWHIFGHEFTLQPIPETGFLGVDLFFFLSGFCLFWPYARAAIEGRREPTLAHFADRRVRKIVPSYVATIAILIAIGFARWDTFGHAVRDVGFHLLFIHNWFGATFGTIDGTMWSLGTEIQFYIVFPLIVWIFRKNPWVSWLGMCALALAWRVTFSHVDTYWIDDMMSQTPAVLDLFATGMIAAWIVPLLRVHAPRLVERQTLWTLVAIAGFVAFWFLILSVYAQKSLPHWDQYWKVWNRPLLGLAFAAIAIGSSFAHRIWHALLANPVLVWLAAISYNLYLWHVPILRFWIGRGPFRSLADVQGNHNLGLLYYAIAIPSALAVGAAFTYGFERPIMALRVNPFARGRPSVGISEAQ